MSSLTPNLLLTKPAGGENYDVAVGNGNSDKIDTGWKSHEDRLDALDNWTDYVPVLKNATSGAVLPSTGPFGKYLILGKLIIVKGSLTSTNATAGGCSVSLPVPAAWIDVACGNIGIYGAAPPADQSGIARVSNDLDDLIVIAFSGGFRDAPAAHVVRWSVMYEIS